MIALLTFLIRYCPSLFERPGVRFKNSDVGRNPAEGSFILLESDDLQIYVCNEMEKITWQMRSVHDPKNKNWFSFDLIARLLGYEVATGVMDAANSDLLSKNLEKIVKRFSKEEVSATLKRLNKLKVERTKHL